jgi:hypothetical protein
LEFLRFEFVSNFDIRASDLFVQICLESPLPDVIPLGTNVRVTQFVELAPAALKLTVTGKLYARDWVATSSAFAGQEGGHYWVERIYIEKEDGERSGILIDQNTTIVAV